MIAGAVSIALCLVLVSRAILFRQRAGQPMARYALIWGTIVAIGFAIALTVDHHLQ